MKDFLILLVLSLTIRNQSWGAPKHLLVETEDYHEEPRMTEEEYFDDYPGTVDRGQTSNK